MSWLLKLTDMSWVAPPISSQTVAISYREGGTAGAFTSSGNITFSSTGAIVGTPNPFVIAAIDDAWGSIEIKAVNSCNSVDKFKTFNKPV